MGSLYFGLLNSLKGGYHVFIPKKVAIHNYMGIAHFYPGQLYFWDASTPTPTYTNKYPITICDFHN